MEFPFERLMSSPIFDRVCFGGSMVYFNFVYECDIASLWGEIGVPKSLKAIQTYNFNVDDLISWKVGFSSKDLEPKGLLSKETASFEETPSWFQALVALAKEELEIQKRFIEMEDSIFMERAERNSRVCNQFEEALMF